jgi:hypothetical protein
MLINKSLQMAYQKASSTALFLLPSISVCKFVNMHFCPPLMDLVIMFKRHAEAEGLGDVILGDPMQLLNNDHLTHPCISRMYAPRGNNNPDQVHRE